MDPHATFSTCCLLGVPTMSMRSICYGLILVVAPASHVLVASADESVQFERDVLPILAEHCLGCHGPEDTESMLRLDSMLGALSGGNSGEKTIEPGNSDKSYLLELITHKNPARRMPPDADPLPKKHIEIIRRWIDDADQWNAAKRNLAERKVDHWSFLPLEVPKVPDMPGNIKTHAIDAFIAVRLQQSKLAMSPRANPRRLIRRLFLVMHGLPPTPKQVAEFIADSRTDAWQRLVDDVLNSPRYGERWGQHWLDLARFGETTGYETNRERPNAWHYRDWVIDAFNNDKPYDQFIIEQIAGDAVGADIGTSFLVAGPNDIVKSSDPNLTKTQRQDELADMINTTSTAFLGLTVGCARCHNHKFDAISQTDYYAMQAVFSGVNHADRSLPLNEKTQRRLKQLTTEISGLTEKLQTFIRKADSQLQEAVNSKQNVETLEPIASRFVRFTINATTGGQPCIDELEIYAGDKNVALASAKAKPSSSGDFVHPLHKLSQINDGKHGNANSWISSVVKGGWVQIELPKQQTIDRIIWQRDRTGQFADRLATDYQIESSTDGKQWTTIASSANRKPYKKTSSAPQYDFAAFSKTEAAMGRQWLKQLTDNKKLRTRLQQSTKVYAGTFRQPEPTHRLYRGEHGSPRELVAPAGITSLSGPVLLPDSREQDRRLAIAKWIASEQNPLTARVIVNRLWQFHFGTGIVDTPSDLGANGTLPTHPQLLDWLATDLIRNKWSLKQMHRSILLSKTWQQDSRPQPDGLKADAGSRLLWRFPPRRLEGEGIRDCILAVTKKLDLNMGGPGFSAFEVDLENVRHYFPKKSYGPTDWRRMVYMTKVRQERDSVFGVFDCPDNSQVTPKRSRSTTPLQALNLLNSSFVMQQADFLVKRLDDEHKDPEAKIHRAYELCFGRSAESDEVAAAVKFIAATNWTQFARAMLNANEFVFVP